MRIQGAGSIEGRICRRSAGAQFFYEAPDLYYLCVLRARAIEKGNELMNRGVIAAFYVKSIGLVVPAVFLILFLRIKKTFSFYCKA